MQTSTVRHTALAEVDHRASLTPWGMQVCQKQKIARTHLSPFTDTICELIRMVPLAGLPSATFVTYGYFCPGLASPQASLQASIGGATVNREFLTGSS